MVKYQNWRSRVQDICLDVSKGAIGAIHELPQPKNHSFQLLFA
ncbi:MAG: hypothetical protein V7K14_01255 [Nostoc sp.]